MMMYDLRNENYQKLGLLEKLPQNDFYFNQISSIFTYKIGDRPPIFDDNILYIETVCSAGSENIIYILN